MLSKFWLPFGLSVVGLFAVISPLRAETPREALERFCVSNRKTVLLDGYCPNVFASVKSRSTLSEIADSMDCDLENFYGFYLLRKRYATGQDVPAVTIDEMNRALGKMKQGSDLFGVNVTPTPDEKESLTGNGKAVFSYRLADLVKIPKIEGSSSDWVVTAQVS